MSSLTFYTSPMSTATVTEVVLAELGVPCEKISLDLRKGESKTPEFLKLNPNGCVPTIVHDGAVIWEAVAITLHLGETFGVEKGLFPAPGAKRAEAMKWLVWSHVTLGSAVNRFARNTTEWYPADQRNAVAGAAAKTEVEKCLAILDAGLGDREFLAGPYGITDAHIHSMADWIRHLGFDFSALKNLNAWAERCSARPAYKAVMAEQTKAM